MRQPTSFMSAGVGMSRLYHDQHWATDALVGAAIGAFIGRCRYP